MVQVKINQKLPQYLHRYKGLGLGPLIFTWTWLLVSSDCFDGFDGFVLGAGRANIDGMRGHRQSGRAYHWETALSSFFSTLLYFIY
jgi:hypothetical protein